MVTRLCGVGEVPGGGVRRVKLDGIPAIAVYNIEGQIYATADRCTHAGASLSTGVVVGDTIECPLHGCRFRISTGEPLEEPCLRSLRTYVVSVRDENIVADLTDRAGFK